MKLIVATPTAVAVSAPDVLSLRAEDESGWFGILPRHADFVTALALSVVSWRQPVPSSTAAHAEFRERYCAVRGGVLTVRGGNAIAIATREAVVGEDLDRLEHEVLAEFRAGEEAEATARTGAARLHVAAVQRLMTYLRPAPQEVSLGHLRTARNNGGFK